MSLPGPLSRPFAVVLVLLLAWGCGGDARAGANDAAPDRTPGSAAQTPSPATPSSGVHPRAGLAWVIFGADTVVAEVADTPESREQGLMHRTSLEENQGMLFVYPSSAPRSFWMRNTLIPLDIAFLDERQVVVDIQQMEPLSEELHDSAAPAMFALETNQGWFATRGIAVGAQARIVFGRR